MFLLYTNMFWIILNQFADVKWIMDLCQESAAAAMTRIVVKWKMPIASKEVSVPESFASSIRSAYGLLILTVSPPSTSPPSVQASRPLAFALLCRTLKGVAGLILDDTYTWRRPDIWLLFVYFVSRHIDAHWAYCSCCFFSSWFGLSGGDLQRLRDVMVQPE